MKTYEVAITDRAKREMEEAWSWINEQSSQAAVNWWNGLVAAMESLAQYPERHARAAESDIVGEEVRQLLYGRGRSRYRVLFIIEGSRVLILHIRHGLRDIMRKGEW